MTVLTVLPGLLMTTTAFTRVLIVLAVLRQGLGTQQTPSNQILAGLALFLTLFIMGGGFRAWEQGASPYLEDQLALEDAVGTALPHLYDRPNPRERFNALC